MPSRALQGIRVSGIQSSFLDVACASEDIGACALACPSGYQGTRALEGIHRNDGPTANRAE